MRVYGRKTAYVNTAIIIINVLCFLYLELQGSTENAGFMLAHGAMFAPLVVDHGQYYRLVTSVFMHFGVSHLMNNMLVLFVLGDNLERALGHVKYLILYLFSGIGANWISMMIGNNDLMVVSAGASGAIFGVIGGLFYAVAVNKGRLEDLQTKQLAVMIVLSLYMGLTSSGVDNAAHVAGLILGILLGILLYRKPKKKMDDGGVWNER